MKRLILLLGANGVGKSTAAGELWHILPRAAYVDSDALRFFTDPSPDPAEPCAVTVSLRLANIHAILYNYFASTLVDTVVFPYGLHGYRRQLLAKLLDTLRVEFDFRLIPVLLYCSEEENIRRMRADGRGEARIKRALERAKSDHEDAETDFPDLFFLDTTKLTPRRTADMIAERSSLI
jgi:hypothetical protein